VESVDSHTQRSLSGALLLTALTLATAGGNCAARASGVVRRVTAPASSVAREETQLEWFSAAALAVVIPSTAG
jgi:hypothetical protein